MSSWVTTVTKVLPTLLTPRSVNSGLSDLELRTDYLKDRINSLSESAYLTITTTKLDSSVNIGSVVYFDDTDKLFKKALAMWDSTYNTNGELTLADSAKVTGLVINKTTNTAGTILLEGVYTGSSTLISNLFNTSTPETGTYYLSGSESGQVTSSPPAVEIPCIEYFDSNQLQFKNTSSPDHNHIHKSYTLSTSNWLNTTDSQFDSMTKPSGAQKGYDLNADDEVKDLFTTFPGECVVVYQGELKDTSYFAVNSDNIWWKNAGTPTEDVILYATVPVSHGQPIIRTLESGNADLSITSNNGAATLTTADWTEDTTDYTSYSATAIQSLDGRTYRKSNIISSLTAGSGASVSVDSYGRAVVSLETETSSLLYPQVIDLNNAMYNTDSGVTKIIFPENRSASVVGTIPISAIPSGFTATITIFVEPEGITGNGTYPAVTITATHIDRATATTPFNTSSASTLSTSVSSFSSIQSYKYYKTGTSTLTITTPGILYVKLEIASGTANKIMHGFGALLTYTEV